MLPRKEAGNASSEPQVSTTPKAPDLTSDFDQLSARPVTPALENSGVASNVPEDAADVSWGGASSQDGAEKPSASTTTTPLIAPVKSSEDAAPILMQSSPLDHTLALTRAAAKVVRALDKLEPLRQTTLLFRNELDYEHESAKYKRNYFTQSGEVFVESASKALNYRATRSKLKGRSSSLSRKLIKRQELLVQDEHSLKEQEDKIRQLQAELSRKEFTMQTREKALYDATRQLVELIKEAALDGPGSIAFDTVSGDVSSEHSLPSRAQSPVLPEIVSDYFDKAGDVNIMQDRLVELVANHRDESVVRLLRQDQDETVDPPDEEFERLHLESRQKADKELRDAVTAASAAKQACLDEGYDIYKYQRHSSIDEETIPRTTTTFGEEEGPITPDHTLAVPMDGFLHRYLSSNNLTTLTDKLESELTSNLDAPSRDPLLQSDEPDMGQVNKRVEAWIVTVTPEADDPAILERPETPIAAPPPVAEIPDSGGELAVPSLHVDQANSTDHDSAITPESLIESKLDSVQLAQSSEFSEFLPDPGPGNRLLEDIQKHQPP